MLPLAPYRQPRECLRSAEVNTVKRLEQCYADLKCQGICGMEKMEEASNVLGPRRGGLLRLHRHGR